MVLQRTTERRQTLLNLLCQRRHDTVDNLAFELSVSRNTIINDILVLSMTYPIYTQQGKGGGVFVFDGFSLGMKYLSEKQLELLIKVSFLLTEEDDIYTLQTIINTYRNPISNEDDKKSEAIKILRKIKSNSFNVKRK